jgi:histone deacetylase 1/2
VTPATHTLFDINPDAPVLDDKAAADFHSNVAKVLYLAKRTRPDLLLATSFLTTRVLCPDQDDLKKLNRLLRYINGTQELGLVLRPGDNPVSRAFIDASYGVHRDKKSHSGLCEYWGDALINAKSTKQKLNTQSSTESELVAVSDLMGLVMKTRNFLKEQGEDPPESVLCQDNMSTIAMIERGESNSDRSRHIDIRYFWVNDLVERKEIKVVHVPTAQMVADLNTKPLQGKQFLDGRKAMLNM